MSLVLVLLGAATAVLGRHTVLGIAIGCGLMLAGWAGMEIRDRKEG